MYWYYNGRTIELYNYCTACKSAREYEREREIGRKGDERENNKGLLVCLATVVDTIRYIDVVPNNIAFLIYLILRRPVLEQEKAHAFFL